MNHRSSHFNKVCTVGLYKYNVHCIMYIGRYSISRFNLPDIHSSSLSCTTPGKRNNLQAVEAFCLQELVYHYLLRLCQC